jgi:phenylpropionate dioxygenase-like ring-hydroxylating dioxygenase large terminal subunit
MIPNQWYAVLESAEVPAGKVVGVTRMGEKLVFWRDGTGKVSCLRDACPHRGVALSAGRVLEGAIECPFHAFRYDASGRCILLPANGRAAPISREMKAFDYPTHEAHGLVSIWWGRTEGDLHPPRWFANIDEGFSYATVRDPWRTHYSRAIENQLDVAHVPFVHRNTIGRGQGPVVNGPWTEWQTPDHFILYVQNRADDGARPVRPDEASHPDKQFWLEFIYPNLWQNHLGDDARIFVAFVPVDDENTILYLRFYQKFVRTPVLRDIVNRLAMPFNILVTHQDRRVVETQLPKRTALKMGEKLVQADRPIVEYRRRRQELIRAAESPPDPPSAIRHQL